MKKRSLFLRMVLIKTAMIVVLMTSCSAPATAQSSQSRYPVITRGTPVFAVGNGWYQITVPAGTLTIYTVGSADTILEIYDSSGKMLAQDDDSGENRNARISISVSAGTYFIGAGTYRVNNAFYVIHAE